MTKTNSSDKTKSQIKEFLENEGYEMGPVIGYGTSSKVREVYHSDGKLAVKIISRKTSKMDDFISNFLPRELSVVIELDHPHIIQAYRVVDFEESVYIFMELAEGGDLLQYLKDHKFLSENQARDYFTQLLSAVRYLHDRQLVHRDLKCENVLIHGNGTLKLTDFGFSRKCVDPVSGKHVLSETFCGSSAYAAPEVLEHCPYNPKMSDMWSLGIILYIMVTGSMPFDDQNLSKMVRHQKQRQIIYPSGLSDDCVSLIRHLLEPKVDFRFTIKQAEKHIWLNSLGEEMDVDTIGRGSGTRISPQCPETEPAESEEHRNGLFETPTVRDVGGESG